MRLSSALQELAQRALVAYVRSIFLQPNKAVFDASALPAADFALSMGLTSVPKLRFLKRHGPKKVLEGMDFTLSLQSWPCEAVLRPFLACPRTALCMLCVLRGMMDVS